jgi:hypothetical protein
MLVEAVDGAGDIDDGLLCCQLKVEKQKAEAWLGLLQSNNAGCMPSSGASSSMPPLASSVVQGLTHNVVCSLLWGNSQSMKWHFSSYQEAESALGPMVRPVVLAAMKAQAIVSVMHSKLLKLVVPGCCSSNAVLLSEGSRVPEAWKQWRGVVVFDRAVMERGDSVAATPGALQPANNTPAAVFCQEVGVVQLGSSVQEMGCPGTPTEGTSGGAVFKVLKKPRMFLAV